MRLSVASTVLALAAATAAQWTFSDASVSVGKANKVVEKFTDSARVKKTVTLGPKDALKVLLTTKEGDKPKRPHQAFLVVKGPSGLEAPFPMAVKENGKGVVQISQKDLPAQLLGSSSVLEASLILGSAGPTKGSVTPVFDVAIELDPQNPAPSPAAPLRYGKLAEIHHIFRADPKNPPQIVSAVFALGVLATVPALFAGWLALGGNLCNTGKALGNAPVSHALFFGSIVAVEGVFFLYYTSWNLLQTLPVLGVVAAVAFFSGIKALGEVQGRRLAGQR
ncbi:uncharacterized protein UV8b_01698 [Ustilaginoidea virens]|uniref:Ribophorin II C-terminal domain-containing protein n=1 Tax=Ustilaginoidea virens TaxID=1159556 RepID=A0A1B5KS47_USTVR|nr:uncharacterized protein UV8b_01698 [Ustilaginoidea virens]QUC17457.1 hypothetical protein UV8b_01698 [Ustilaginoidea virens]GAO13673.1 hypothetical protein UVI_02017760 [Ustilaginoidea virens]